MSTHALDHHHQADSTDVFGFWLYIMSDCLLFASLFATFIVLHHDGLFVVPLKSLIELPYVLLETVCLLTSNFAFGLAVLSMYKSRQSWMVFWLIVTVILGVAFVGLEINEFIHFFREGYSYHLSGSASAFFVLVGTHGFHVTMGLIWMVIMIVQVCLFGITAVTRRRITYLGLFWNFLDIVWIFVFTIVYLMGAV